MRSFSVLVCCLTLLLQASASNPAFADPLFTIIDPRGDDHGGGDIVYPGRSDLEQGDLDLLALSVDAVEDGTRFEARFANPIRSPKDKISYDNTRLTSLVHEDFYTINLEVYIDTDAELHSGNTEIMPGRKAVVAGECAWEKALVVTPRPQVAETLLRDFLVKERKEAYKAEHGRVAKEESKKIKKRVKEEVGDQFHFPNRIEVWGRSLRFFVPDDFLGSSPKDHWRYVVVVTGANPEPSMDISINVLNYKRTSPLMMIPVEPGRSRDVFGLASGADPDQPPIVDLLLPTVELQRRILGDYDVVAGRLTRLTGITARGEAIELPPRPPVQREAAEPAETEAPEVTSPETVEQDTGAAPVSEIGEKASIAERLKELNRLLEEKLITREEYDELRLKILMDL